MDTGRLTGSRRVFRSVTVANVALLLGASAVGGDLEVLKLMSTLLSAALNLAWGSDSCPASGHSALQSSGPACIWAAIEVRSTVYLDELRALGVCRDSNKTSQPQRQSSEYVPSDSESRISYPLFLGS